MHNQFCQHRDVVPPGRWGAGKRNAVGDLPSLHDDPAQGGEPPGIRPDRACHSCKGSPESYDDLERPHPRGTDRGAGADYWGAQAQVGDDRRASGRRLVRGRKERLKIRSFARFGVRGRTRARRAEA